MTLQRYIDKYGTKHLAELLGVSERRVLSWYYGERQPRPIMAHKIQELTNRKVRFEECYK